MAKRTRLVSETERALFEKGWRTSDTYCNTYRAIPQGPGVYLFECLDFDNAFKSLGIVYVGQAKNLSKRLDGGSHEIFKQLNNDPKRNWFIRRWFKRFPLDELREIERFYIAFFDPPFNIIGRRRGFAATKGMTLQ